MSDGSALCVVIESRNVMLKLQVQVWCAACCCSLSFQQLTQRTIERTRTEPVQRPDCELVAPFD